MSIVDQRYYLFGSRILTHLVFWVVYYLFFSLLWAKDGDYYASFGLELVLMPLRIFASYVSMYVLIPRLLLSNREPRFVLFYLFLIIVTGICQRILVYFYYEVLFSQPETSLFDPGQLLRAMVLINSTVLLLSAVKIFQYWKIERSIHQPHEEFLEIRAEKRNYRVRISEISYVEALGNYVNYYLTDGRRLISYCSLKEVENLLPSAFSRIHKSFIVNMDHIDSYTNENVEIGGKILPIGKKNEVSFN